MNCGTPIEIFPSMGDRGLQPRAPQSNGIVPLDLKKNNIQEKPNFFLSIDSPTRRGGIGGFGLPLLLKEHR
ncbi:MAG: hypothetical protein HOO06_10950 [Bdellovibrionaceae bacterium]|nr:hypothetical protein [Pseudobdellovibrionaceae bacterium]